MNDIEQYREEVAELQSGMAALPFSEITEQPQYLLCKGILPQVNSNLRRLEELRKSATRPLDESKKQIMAWFRDPTDKLKAYKANLNGMLVEWDRKQAEEARKRREAAQGQVEREAAALKEVGVETRPEVRDAPEPRAARTRVSWVVHVENKAELVRAIADGKAELDWVAADQVALNTHARDMKGECSIPGCRVEKRVSHF